MILTKNPEIIFYVGELDSLENGKLALTFLFDEIWFTNLFEQTVYQVSFHSQCHF